MSNSNKIKTGKFIEYLKELKPQIDAVIEQYMPRQADNPSLWKSIGNNVVLI